MAHPGRLRITLVSLILAAFLAAGCGGGGDDVSRSTHDMLQEELDAALALVMQTETARDAARAEVTRLTGELATANTSISSLTTELATAKTSVTSLTDDLSDAEADVTRLTNQIGTATDATSLQGMLAAANARVTKLTTDLATANGQVTTLTGQLTVARSEAASLRRLLTAAQTQVTEERDRADQAVVDAQAEITQQVQQQTQGNEANQRAERFNTELRESDVVAAMSPVTVDLTTRGRVRLTRGTSYSAATLGDRPSSGSGMRVATLPLTGSGDTGKTVIYTDIELTRSLVEEYLPGSQETRLPLDTAVEGTGQTGPETLSNETIPEDSANWKISHGVPTSVNAVVDPEVPGATVRNTLPATAMNPRRAGSYSGSLHGVSGRFVCTGTSCRVQVTPMYGALAAEKFPLSNVMLDSVNAQGVAIEDGDVYFVPSARLPLYTGTGNQRGGDEEYMVFGYWRQDPVSPASPYQFHVFADAVGGGGTIAANVTAVYDGLAVGSYAERDPGAAVVTWRQGEFTADVDLNATSAGVRGTIDDFVATPTGGSSAPKTVDNWLINLGGTADDNTRSAPNADGTLTMPNLPGGAGDWSNELVEARPATATAPAITGTFTAGVENSVSIVGAFGAELSSTQ